VIVMPMICCYFMDTEQPALAGAVTQ